MKILNLKINNFGKLSNKEINLNGGINIIYGKNESGKSTLLKFIMGMFYGLSKNKNGRFMPDYERYIPWNGGEFSGKITYKLDNGEKYEVFREFKKKNPKIYNESLEDISNNFNIDKINGNKFFYDQTNVDEELFISTIVSMQEETKLEEKEQTTLIQKLSNLVSTGEDNLSFQKIMAKLSKKQIEEIGTSRSIDRPINIVTKRLEQIQNEKENLNSFTTKQYEIDDKSQNLEKEIKQQESELELLKELRNLQERQQLEKEKIKINEEVIKEYNKKIEKLKDKLGIETKDKNVGISVVPAHKVKRRFLAILSILFAISTAISIFAIKNDIITALNIVLLVVTVIYLGYTQYKNKIGIIEKEKLENVETSNIKNEIDVLTKSILKLENETYEINYRLENENLEEKEKLRNKYMGIIPIKTIDENLVKNSLIYDINVLQNKISENKIQLHTTKVDKDNILPKMENLANLEEEYAQLEEQYKNLYDKNEQINLAKIEIEKAYEEIKKDVTPKFTSNLSKIIERVSEGKYTNIQFDEKNGMIVEIENGNYVDARNLSIGTIDELYLSLRLGAGVGISKENLPIILDETFAYWDNIRLENILKYINEELGNRQVILFTCTNREMEILEKLGINYNKIEL